MVAAVAAASWRKAPAVGAEGQALCSAGAVLGAEAGELQSLSSSPENPTPPLRITVFRPAAAAPVAAGDSAENQASQDWAELAEPGMAGVRPEAMVETVDQARSAVLEEAEVADRPFAFSNQPRAVLRFPRTRLLTVPVGQAVAVREVTARTAKRRTTRSCRPDAPQV